MNRFQFRRTLVVTLSGILGWVQPPAIAQDDDGDDIEPAVVDTTDIPLQAEEACFNINAVRDHDTIGYEHVLIEARSDDFYLLTMQSGCPGLRNAIDIAISNEFTRICSNRQAKIFYRGLGGLESCLVRRVESVDSKEAAVQIVESRTR